MLRSRLMTDVAVIYPHEVILKKGSRRFFERRLMEDITARIGIAGCVISKEAASMVVVFPRLLDEGAKKSVVAVLAHTFGIAAFSLGRRSMRTPAAITTTALALLAGTSAATFKIETRRADKTFALTSYEVSSAVGALVRDGSGLTVDVRRPDVTVFVDIHADAAIVAVKRHAGAGGLPTGTAGKLVALLSGGIDSPVSAWKTMRRGGEIIAVHFHSMPFVGSVSVEKVRRLAGQLATYQGTLRLHLVPFADVQCEIVARAPAPLRVILYRRAMLRIAERIAAAESALGLVTGDAIGQVASQTLENLLATTDAASLPVYRPLIGDDKEDIMNLARRIGTYEISIEPHDDCCTLFVPPHPATRATNAEVRAAEALFDVEVVIRAAIAATETVIIPSPYDHAVHHRDADRQPVGRVAEIA